MRRPDLQPAQQFGRNAGNCSVRGPAPWVSAMISFAVAFVLYLPTLSHSFTYDDKVAILGNPDVGGLVSDPWSLWRHDFWGNAMMGAERSNHTWTHNSWRPLVVLGLRMERVLAGEHWAAPPHEGGTQWVFHASSILMHAMLAAGASRIIALLLLVDETDKYNDKPKTREQIRSACDDRIVSSTPDGLIERE